VRADAQPKAATAALIACVALLASGCGSSGSRSSSASSQRSSAGSSGAGSPSGGGGLKVTTTPKFGSPPASAPVLSGTVNVAYRNITIQPDTLKVKVGTTIVWTNHDPVQDNVTSQSGPTKFASRNLSEGQTFRVTLTKPGVIHYLSTTHPASVNGTIEVVR
jgi:plastocyanin